MQFNSSLVTSLAFKTAGLVMILSTVVNVLLATLPYQLSDITWWAATGAELLNRGFFSLVGIVFLTVGHWIETVSKESGRGGNKNWFFWSALISTILGVMYLAVIPFQILVANNLRDKGFDQINQGVGKEEEKIKTAFGILDDKTKSQQRIAELDQQIKSGQFQGNDLNLLNREKVLYEKLSSDPIERKKEMTRSMSRISEERQSATNQVNANLFKTGIRASLFSLLLAAGHIFIGFTGLRHKP
jgi:hypothetical protein